MDPGWQERWSLVLIWEYTHAAFTLRSQSLSQCRYWRLPACQWHLRLYDSVLMLRQNVINAYICSNGTCNIITPSMAVKPFWWIFIFGNVSSTTLGINPCKFSHKCSLPSGLPDWAVPIWGEWLSNKNYHLTMHVSGFQCQNVLEEWRGPLFFNLISVNFKVSVFGLHGNRWW